LYFFFNLRDRWECMVKSTVRPFYPWERDTISILRDAGWTPGPVWLDAENFAITGIRSSDRPACSLSLPRLRYPGQHSVLFYHIKFRSILTIIEKLFLYLCTVHFLNLCSSHTHQQIHHLLTWLKVLIYIKIQNNIAPTCFGLQ